MNKKFILPIVTLGVLVSLASCGNDGGNGSINIVDNTAVGKAITNMRKGFTLSGQLNQTREFYTDDTFTTIVSGSESEQNLFNLEFKFENNNEDEVPAFSRRSELSTDGGKTFDLYEQSTFFADALGYAYTTHIAYDNTISRSYMRNDINIVTFAGAGFDNPFEYVNSTDFSEQGNGEYILNSTKASYMFTKLIYFLSTGFTNMPFENSFTISGDNFSKASYQPVDRQVIEANEDGTNSYYVITQSVYFDIEAVGETKIERTKAFDHSSANTLLENAFKAAQNDKTTIKLKMTDTSASTPVVTNRIIYLDGKNGYIKYFDGTNGSATAINAENDYMLIPNEQSNKLESYGYDEKTNSWEPSNSTKFLPVYQEKYSYSDLVPVIDKVSGDAFEYNATGNYYEARNSDIVSSLATSCFTSVVRPTYPAFLSLTSICKIFLNSSDEIDYIRFEYTAADTLGSGLIRSGYIDISYSDIGTTVIPFNALG